MGSEGSGKFTEVFLVGIMLCLIAIIYILYTDFKSCDKNILPYSYCDISEEKTKL